MNTIKSSQDISTIFKEGRRIGTPELSLIVFENPKYHDLNGRVAFIAGKKLGNAVWHNRAKRRMRAVFHDLNLEFPSYDVVFLAKKNVTRAEYPELFEHTRKAFDKAGLTDVRTVRR